MRKTYKQRILGYLYEKEERDGFSYFSKDVAKKRFKKVSDLHGTVMRVAREMSSNGLLERVDRGFFILTDAGRRSYKNQN